MKNLLTYTIVWIIRLKYCAFDEFDGRIENMLTMLRALNLGKVCEANDIVYIDLVKQFYANLRMLQDHAWSIVNETQFAFDVRELNELLGMPNEDNDMCDPKTKSPIIDYEDLKRSFFGNPHGDSLSGFKMNFFTPLYRVLYHIVVNVLALISGHYTNVSHLHLFMEFLEPHQSI